MFVDVFAGAVAVAGVLSGVRGLEHFCSHLDRRPAVPPHKLSHTGTNNLPLQTRGRPAEEDRLNIITPQRSHVKIWRRVFLLVFWIYSADPGDGRADH